MKIFLQKYPELLDWLNLICHNSRNNELKNLLKVFEISNKIITFVVLFDEMKYSELFRILKKDGWFEVRQKGSHIIMAHPEKHNKLIVPFHSSKEVKKGMLGAILKDANIKISKR